jgi:predicted phage terminase large subunit-like protein
VRVVVAVDPSGGSGEGNDEQGIVVCGLGVDRLGYVIADRSCRLSPDGWGRRAVRAFVDSQADRLLWESNFGGEMVEAVVTTIARDMGVMVPTKKVVASRGKRLRAEPIAALFEQSRVMLVGEFPELEDQLVSFTPTSSGSPDRLDAMVMALAELMLGPGMATDVSDLIDLNKTLRNAPSLTPDSMPGIMGSW